MCTVDKRGNALSATYKTEVGAGRLFPGSGLFPYCAADSHAPTPTTKALLGHGDDPPHTQPDSARSSAAVEVIVAEPSSGFLRAGADPRQPASAIVR